MYSLPYSSVLMWSTENRGILDTDVEMELWTKIGQVKIRIGKDIDIRKIDKILSSYIL